MYVGGGGGVGSGKIPTDKTTYTPKMIFDKVVAEYMNKDEKCINRAFLIRKFVLDYDYSEKKANKWIDTFVELLKYDEKSGYIYLK